MVRYRRNVNILSRAVRQGAEDSLDATVREASLGGRKPSGPTWLHDWENPTGKMVAPVRIYRPDERGQLRLVQVVPATTFRRKLAVSRARRRATHIMREKRRRGGEARAAAIRAQARRAATGAS